MIKNKYELAVAETKSVLSEWIELVLAGERIDSPHGRDVVSRQIVDRLISKGVIQSTDPDDLHDWRKDDPKTWRTGPLEPGNTVTGGGGPIVRTGKPAGPVVMP